MMPKRNAHAMRHVATIVALWLSTTVLGCASAPFKQDPGRRLAMDGITLAYIGREALSEYGYEEIIRRAVDAKFLRYPTPEQTNAQEFVGQTLEDAARQAWPVFTEWAVAASVTSQVDSPAPGPADVVALGMIVVGLVSAGFVAAMVYSSPGVVAATPAPTATAVPTATATTTTTSPPIAAPRRCLPCLPVPVGGTSYIYHSAAAGNDPHYGMANHTHHYEMHQSPPEKGCRCFWKPDFIHPTPEFSPLSGAVPWSTAVGGGIAP